MFGIVYIFDMIISSMILFIKRISFKSKAVIIGLIFGLLGLMMTPKFGNFTDIVRFFSELDTFRENIEVSSFSNVFSYMIHSNSSNSTMDTISQYSSVPVMGTIMMIMSYLKNGWLIFLVSFIDMSSASYLALNSSSKYLNDRNNNKFNVYVWIIFTCLFNFNATIGGIRNGLVSFIFILAYWLFLNEKRNSIFIKLTILVVILALIHPFSLIIYLLAILSIYFYKHNIIMFILEIILLCQHFYQAVILEHLGNMGNSSFISSVNYKSTQYFGSNAYIGVASNFSAVRFTLQFFLFVILVFFVRHYSTNTLIYQKYNAFTDLLIAFTMGSYTDQILFSRCVMLMVVVIIPYLIRLVCIFNDFNKKPLFSIFKFVFILLLIISLADNIRAGIRFFNLTFNNII